MPGEVIPYVNPNPTQFGQLALIQPKGGFWSKAWAGTKAVGGGIISLAGLAALAAWLWPNLLGGLKKTPDTSKTPNISTKTNFPELLYSGLIGAGLGAGGGWLYDALFGDEDADEKRKKQHLRNSLLTGALLGTLVGVGPKLLGSLNSQK